MINDEFLQLIDNQLNSIFISYLNTLENIETKV
jgi:hypothetical protein